MTNTNDARRAHDVLDGLFAGRVLSRENEQLLRSFLPELPKPATLADLLDRVHDAWISANPSDWGFDTPAEHHDWLFDLRNDLVRIIEEQGRSAKPTRPEFLETEADYENAPEGTIVACDDSPPWHKFDSAWISAINWGSNSAESMSGIIREVLRWGWGE